MALQDEIHDSFDRAEVTRIAAGAIDASELAEHEHSERTASREGRVHSMTEDWQERRAEAEPWTQERVDGLLERAEADDSPDTPGSVDDARRATVELMAAQVEGHVGTEREEDE